MESSRVVSNQIYYKQSEEFAPRYKYVKINMSNIMGNTVTLNTTSINVQFKLPYNTVYNLSKSKLATLVPIGAQANTYCSYMNSDAWPFGNQTVSLETGNGLQLLNLPESSRYTKVLTKINTPFKDFMTTDNADMPRPNTNTPLENNPTGLGTPGTNLYEPKYFNTSVVSDGAGAGINNIPIYYELGNFVHSILSLDKDLYAGQNDLYIKYSVGGIDSFAFRSTSLSNPATNVATLSANTLPALQNVYLYLAVEQQPQIIENIVQAYQSTGLRILIDYPIVTKFQTAINQSNQAIVIPFVPAQGRYLKRVYHSVFSTADTLNTALDCENSTAVRSGQAGTTSKLLSYNTYIDSLKLQDDIVYCGTAGALAAGVNNVNVSASQIYEDDWRVNQQFCKDSAILNYSVYQKNWFHCDSFEPPRSNTVGNVDPQNLKNGLPMERGVQYQFICNVASNNANVLGLIHTNFAIFSREILINRDGIQFV